METLFIYKTTCRLNDYCGTSFHSFFNLSFKAVFAFILKVDAASFHKNEGLIVNNVIKFINKRFKKDCDWLNGNRFYFAIILKSRFPEGKIFYDVINGHFVFLYNDVYYDWTGCIKPDGYLVDWDKFDEYDSLQKKVIIRDCLM